MRRKTALLPVKRNVTRLSSTFAMVKRFFEILEFIDIRDPELLNLIPYHQEEEDLRALFEDLKNFESVSLKLQEEETDLLVVRRLFDALIEKYSDMKEYLSPKASIVHSPDYLK